MVRRTLGLAAAVVLAAAAPAHAEKVGKLGKTSYFAYVEKAGTAYSAAKTSAKKVAKIKPKSPEGTDDVVLVLEHKTIKEQEWYRVRLPVKPNGTTGWVKAESLSDLQPVDTWLRVSTKTFKATLVKNGKTVFSASIGVGQPQWPTPKGQFYVRAMLRGYGGKGSFYGPLAFITSATSPTLTDWPGGAVVGVHGTSQPELIPGKISHGCVRMKNADILKLAKLMPVGTPITVT